MIQQLLLASLILSSIPAFGFSAAASAAADVKTGAAHMAAQSGETDGKMTAAQYDGEIDTSVPGYTYEPPSAEALKEAHEKASKQKNQLGVLEELCKPYFSQCDPYYFAAEVFERWKKLCEDMGLLVGGKFTYNDDFNANAQKYNILNPIVGSCLGMAHVMRLTKEYIYDDKLPDRRVRSCYYRFSYNFTCLHPRTFEILEDPSKYPHIVFQDRRNRYPRTITQATMLLHNLACIVGDYANEFGFTVAESLQRSPCRAYSENTHDLSFRMIHSLEGLQRTADCVLLDHNLISSLHPDDFASYCCKKALTLDNNGIRFVAPGTFAKQSKLKMLFLGSNRLCRIDKSTFAGLVKLKRLSVFRNGISFVEEGALVQLPSLRELSLENNALRKIPADIETLVNRGQLTGLLLDGNPFENDPIEAKKLAELMAKVEQNKKAFDAVRSQCCSVQ